MKSFLAASSISLVSIITILAAGCSRSDPRDLLKELKSKSQTTGLALARVRGELAEVITFDGKIDRRHCPRFADPPFFLQDGNRLIWVDSDNLTIRSIDDSIISQIRLKHSFINAAALSPDGHTMVYENTHLRSDSRLTELYVVRTAGGAPVLIDSEVRPPNERISQMVSWSPDGSLITYSLNGHIVIFNGSSHEKRRIAEGIDPCWSPNGKWIAYVSPNYTARIMAVDTNVDSAILSGHRINGYLHWSPDSQYLMFSEDFKPTRWDLITKPAGSSVRLSVCRFRDGAIAPVFWFGPKGGSDIGFGWIYNSNNFCSK